MTFIDSSDSIKNPTLEDDKLHLVDKPVTPKDDNYLYAASATDMTGLAVTVAHNEYEAQSYEEIFPYLPPIQINEKEDSPIPAVSDGIHAEYRTQVTRQPKHDK